MDGCVDGDKLLAMDEYAGFVSLTWLDGPMVDGQCYLE